MHRLPSEDAWEAYRLYQRDLLQQCFEDADLIARRRHSLFPKEEILLMVEIMFDKRCQPYKYFRDEFRAKQALAKRQSAPNASASAGASPDGASGARA